MFCENKTFNLSADQLEYGKSQIDLLLQVILIASDANDWSGGGLWWSQKIQSDVWIICWGWT